jgi:long-chain fatty acid transport protein
MGIGSDYGNDWSGRYLADKSSLVFVAFSTVAAWRLSEQLSLGANLSLIYSDSETEVAVNNLDPARGDGKIELEMSGRGLGGGVSALYELSPGTRFGLSYNLESKTKLEGTPRWRNIGAGLRALLEAAGVYREEIDMDIHVPQSLQGGFYHELSDRLALMGDLTWIDFSEFGKVDISVGTNSTTTDAHYRDIWAWSLGAEYDLSHRWAMGAGVTYISSGVSDGNRTLALPWDEFWIFGAGVQRQLNPNLRLFLNFMFVQGGDGKIDQQATPLSGRLVGEYSRRRTFVLDLALVWDS